MQKIFLFASFLLMISCQAPPSPTSTMNEGESLIQEMLVAMGGLDKYQNLKDVTYTYTYRDMVSGVQDVSIEKYLYEGELAWAKYTEHSKNIYPESSGPVTEAWNGQDVWQIVEDTLVTNPGALKMVKFGRNTSFFWFNMMYKMLDDGSRHKLLPNRNFDGKEYQIVEVTYEENIGDAQDKFMLYINPASKLTEHFLFSNTFFSKMAPPRMMHIEFATYEGLKFPKRQWYEPADWEGNILEKKGPGPNNSEKIYANVSFNTGVERSLFDKPGL